MANAEATERRSCLLFVVQTYSHVSEGEAGAQELAYIWQSARQQVLQLLSGSLALGEERGFAGQDVDPCHNHRCFQLRTDVSFYQAAGMPHTGSWGAGSALLRLALSSSSGWPCGAQARMQRPRRRRRQSR